MTGVLTSLLVAVAGFTAWSVQRRTAAATAAERVEGEALRRLLYVGSLALVLLAVAVVVTSLATTRADQGQKVAVLGLFAFLVYVIVAVLVSGRARRRGP